MSATIKEKGTVIYYLCDVRRISDDEMIVESDDKVNLIITGMGHQYPLIEKEMISTKTIGAIDKMVFNIDGEQVSCRMMLLSVRNASSKEMKKGVNWNLENKIRAGLQHGDSYDTWLGRDEHSA